MSRFSYKTLFLIVVFLLIPIVFLLRLNQKATPAVARWWNDSWFYRQAINITTHTVGETNVYIITSVNIGTTTKSQTDSGDFRFTTASGQLLDYYISAGAGSTAPTFHVKFASFPSGAQTIYGYYGNSSASNGFALADFSTQASNYSFGSAAQEELGGGPIAYWKFDEGIGTSAFDSSSNKNNGTISGAIWQTENKCVSGKCLYFNGNDKTTVADSAILNITEALSIGLWIKPISVTGRIALLNRSSFSSAADGYSLEIHDGKLTLVINGGRAAGSTQKCNDLVSINEFSYVSWIRNNEGGNKLYINSKECSYESTISSEQAATNTTLGIGSKLGKQSLPPYTDYSNMTYNSPYGAGCWGGDAATVTYYPNGGYNDFPYKKLNKTVDGTGGCFITEHISFPIENNKNYIVSAWMKANQSVTLNGYALDLNRESDNAYRTGTTPVLDTSWQRINWIYNSGSDHAGNYQSRQIIYTDSNLPQDVYWSDFQVEDITGTSYTTPNLDFNGYIDEVKIYSYARTADQIKQDYNQGAVVIGQKPETAQVTPIKSKLVAYYKFDEGYGSVTANWGNAGSSLNVILGTGNSAPTWTNEGKFGKALSFDGSNDYAKTTNTVFLNNTFSISLWAKKTGAGQQIARLTSTWVGDGDFLELGFIGNTLYYDLAYTDLTKTGWQSTGSEPCTNTWGQITLVSNNTGFSIYVNGVLVHSESGMGLTVPNKIIYFGNEGWGTSTFNGLIDDVKIYNYALTADEIKLDYNQGKSLVMGSLSSGTGNTAPSTAASQEYCVPGDTATCSPPVARWDFNEGIGSSAFDTSGNGNNETLGAGNSSPTWTNGKIGKGLMFDGTNDYASVPSNSSFQLTGDITIVAWFNTDRVDSSQNLLTLYSPGGALRYELSQNAATVQAGFNLTGGTIYPTAPAGSVTTGQWYQVTATLSGSTGKIYLNGILAGTEPGTGTLNTIESPLYIGSERGIAAFFKGLLDEVRIYNYARSPAQIAWDYNRGKPIAHYKMDECQGTVINDWSGNGNHGTLSIGASGSQASAGTCQTANTAWGVGATGKTNSSINFDGTDDKVTAGSFTVGANMTISAWIKKDSSTGQKSFFSNRGGGSVYFGLTGTQVFLYDNNGTPPGINSSSGGVAIGQWQHVVATSDGSNIKFFVNGNLIYSTSQTRTASTGTIGIGWDSAMGTEYWDGQIDDVQIFNYALTSTQIKTLYSGGAVNFR